MNSVEHRVGPLSQGVPAEVEPDGRWIAGSQVCGNEVTAERPAAGDRLRCPTATVGEHDVVEGVGRLAPRALSCKLRPCTSRDRARGEQRAATEDLARNGGRRAVTDERCPTTVGVGVGAALRRERAWAGPIGGRPPCVPAREPIVGEDHDVPTVRTFVGEEVGDRLMVMRAGTVGTQSMAVVPRAVRSAMREGDAPKRRARERRTLSSPERIVHLRRYVWWRRWDSNPRPPACKGSTRRPWRSITRTSGALRCPAVLGDAGARRLVWLSSWLSPGA